MDEQASLDKRGVRTDRKHNAKITSHLGTKVKYHPNQLMALHARK
jgi:hypothetical protein